MAKKPSKPNEADEAHGRQGRQEGLLTPSSING